MSLDLLLYVAFGGGFLLGRLSSWRSPWVGRGATASVAVLLFLLGTELGALPAAAVAMEVPLAAAFAVATLLATVGVLALIDRRTTRPSAPRSPVNRSVLLPPIGFVAALLLGVAVGAAAHAGPGPTVEFALYALLALVGFELELDIGRLRSAARPLLAAVVGGTAVATVFALVGWVPVSAAFSTAFAFGWYSLAGPLVGARLGAELGLFAFLANFLRENLTMLSAPALGNRIGGDGLAAMGGATSMDTTLFFITRYGGRESATVGLATGIVLTTAAGLLVPVVLALR
ncbi:MAG TPA: lysine exporter LysO family protein [Thermoplasmata archaeon]|nr:lysine exporter LysO family protein [Thermoplasmata archaeon]